MEGPEQQVTRVTCQRPAAATLKLSESLERPDKSEDIKSEGLGTTVASVTCFHPNR